MYDNLKSLRVLIPDEIDRYIAAAEANNDILKSIFQKDKGEVLRQKRQGFKYPRASVRPLSQMA